MDVNVSEDTKLRISEIAKRKGQAVEDVAGELLDEKVMEIDLDSPWRKTLSDMAGMFYGGPGDTAERASEILRAEMGVEK